MENTSSFVEKILGVKSLEAAIQLQSEFAKSQFEGFFSQTAKIGKVYMDTAKETFKPFERVAAEGKAAVE